MSELYKIPNNYRRNSRDYIPALLRGLEHFIYFNSDDPLTDADFDDWTMGLFIGSNEVFNIGAPVKDDLGSGEFRVYKSFTIPPTVSTNTYRIVIYNSVDNKVKFISNCFELILYFLIKRQLGMQIRMIKFKPLK